MQRLDDYFCERTGAAFARRLPVLRRKLGAVDISHRSSGYGVAGNTFRAYPGWGNRPSDIYNGWAERITKSLDPKSLAKEIATRDGFLDWHTALSISLERRWRHYEGTVPDLAHRLKLIDLFVKWLSSHNFREPQFLAALERNGNCALDSQTLRKMNQAYSNALPIGKPSMGNITNVRSYLLCQDLIQRFSVRFGGSRLLFDYFAWRKGGGS
jgi:hypothetical protein